MVTERKNQDIVVIGASFGGVAALKQMVSHLPGDLTASIFIVIHQSPTGKTALHEILAKNGKLPAVLPENAAKFEPGTIYVAKPNHHLLVKEDHVAITFGPRINRVRPSIDVLFNSAAAFHTTRVVGIIMSGYLNDGVIGLSGIKRCGGIAIAQDPGEAEAAEMSISAIRRVGVDHVLNLEQIAIKITELARRPSGRPVEVPEDIMEEVRVSEHKVPNLEHMRNRGDLTPYTCPECGGVLWKTKNEPLARYVCHTGHSFSQNAFLECQAEVIENSLWSAIRFIQERINILFNLAENKRETGKSTRADEYEKKAMEMKEHLLNIRRFIISGALNSALYHKEVPQKQTEPAE